MEAISLLDKPEKESVRLCMQFSLTVACKWIPNLVCSTLGLRHVVIYNQQRNRYDPWLYFKDSQPTKVFKRKVTYSPFHKPSSSLNLWFTNIEIEYTLDSIPVFPATPRAEQPSLQTGLASIHFPWTMEFISSLSAACDNSKRLGGGWHKERRGADSEDPMQLRMTWQEGGWTMQGM